MAAACYENKTLKASTRHVNKKAKVPMNQTRPEKLERYRSKRLKRQYNRRLYKGKARVQIKGPQREVKEALLTRTTKVYQEPISNQEYDILTHIIFWEN
mmetsp:Transcript_15396/g.33087  ORF Transcript_15396/g.33087 Transcript_15396/m.33087 type:complete len:99 (-) Transcript_15396:196-492(-)|eukprot:CAMPEP_0203760590 /NCGR_PEP_ID=MMETSP0098-20131031/13855_1 /ASSEMBLY_ACC=CAM_ASM_000208 /TAXON_ID=96639 /ORGANISM=" , Strain NY0313808BC1" /LENGTH=98 /DNA_ID=CAMNT_0050654225 /DNA_START=32 /DNA_END=328 /DNA_ORIENTATION=+